MSNDCAEDEPGMPCRIGMLIAVLFALLSGAGSACADEPAAKETAFRLPDGTVVFYTKNPNDPLPAIDGVLLSAKDYKQLLEQAEQLKTAKATSKPASPSVCHIQCTLKATGDRPAATLAITYQFRTTVAGSTVMLGGQKAFAVKAILDDGGPPVLEATADGLIVLIDRAGEHTLKMTFESPVTPRNKGDFGFEFGLPRAAITTLAFTEVPNAKAMLLGTRFLEAGVKVGDVKFTPLDAKRYLPDSKNIGVPLGPTDLLDISWDSPGNTPMPTESSLDVEVNIRVEERSIETTASLALRGPNRDWSLVLPPGMTLVSHSIGDTPTIVGPADAKSGTWTVTLPASTNDATLTATLKQTRIETKTPANYSCGPIFAKGTIRTGGTVRVYAPFNVRVVAKPAADLRRVDTTAAADDSPVTQFRFANVMNLDKKVAPLLEYELRPATGFVVAQPQHNLTFTPLGWRLRSEFRISPVRTALEQLSLELPAGWQDPTFAPLDLVDEVQGTGDVAATQTLALRLATPQREPFVLTLDARFPLAANTRDVSLLLPRLLASRERDTQVTVTVPEPLAVTGTVREWDAGKVAAVAGDFTTAGVETLSGRFDGGVARVDLSWQPAKPRFTADMHAEVTISDRQAVIQQTFKLSFPEGASRSVKFRGPANAAGFRATPSLESIGPGEWSLTSAVREASVTLSYAVPVVLDDAKAWTAPLVWVDASAITSTVRVGGTGTGRRMAGFEGPWREAAPEPNPERDTLPWLTLTGTGANLPLKLIAAEVDATGSVVVERAVHQWVMSESGPPQARSRFVLKRWPALLETELTDGGSVTVFVERQRVEPLVLRSDAAGLKTYGIPLPESKPTRTSLILELRYSSESDAELTPPRLRGAIHRGGAWWHIAPQPGTLPMVFGSIVPEIGWRMHNGLLSPLAGVSEANLDLWLTGNAEMEQSAGDAGVTFQQMRSAPVKFVAVPRLITFTVGVIAMLLLGFGLSRLSSKWFAPALALLIITVTPLVLLWPQPLSQIAYAIQPGFVFTVVVLGLTTAVKSWLRMRTAKQATFSRGTAPAIASSPTIELSANSSRSGSAAASSSPVPSAS